ncbi:hypothetical protein VTN00DRAFT_7273 [Thermoascus crustaceus]|uniref:uncharacterized protein n=1 Tax=Thermoascus crustaceus TaxID=5088 RepID=UPI00374398C5
MTAVFSLERGKLLWAPTPIKAPAVDSFPSRLVHYLGPQVRLTWLLGDPEVRNWITVLAMRHLARAPRYASYEHGRGFVPPRALSRRGNAKGKRCSLHACFSNRPPTVEHLFRLLGPL